MEIKKLRPFWIESRLRDGRYPFNNRCAIICTINQTTLREGGADIVRNMAEAGMSIARFNLGHLDLGDEEHREWLRSAIAQVREAESVAASPLGVMVDLSGPKFRIGPVRDQDRDSAKHDRVVLEAGASYTFTNEECQTTRERAWIKGLDVRMPEWPGGDDRGPRFIVLGDDAWLLLVQDITEHEITCTIPERREAGAPAIYEGEGVLFPQVDLEPQRDDIGFEVVTPKDLMDLEFLAEMELQGIFSVDFISVSFASVAAMEQVENAWRAALGRRMHGRPHGPWVRMVRTIPLIAKLEDRQAVNRCEEILASNATGAVMVARGDLAPNIGIPELPWVQSQIIDRAREAGKPVIVATDLLRSFATEGGVQRPEAVDIYTALESGADGLLLSKETTRAPNRVEAVKALHETVVTTEAHLYERMRQPLICPYAERPGRRRGATRGAQRDNLRDRVVFSCMCVPAVHIAEEIGSTLIALSAATGSTAMCLAAMKPHQIVLALTASERAARRMLLSRGIIPVVFDSDAEVHTPQGFLEALEAAVHRLRISRRHVDRRLRQEMYKDENRETYLRCLGVRTYRELDPDIVVSLMRTHAEGATAARRPFPNTLHIVEIRG